MTGIIKKFKTLWNQSRKAKEVKSFKDNQREEIAFDYRELGTKMVPVEKIVGSVGRYHDFDGKFRLKQHLPKEKLESVRKAMQRGKSLPPVELYQIKDEFYVLDGNHRVSAAKEFGYSEIEAHIIAFIPKKNTFDHILYQEKAEFEEKTKLPHMITLSELGQYPYLLRQISRHRRFLEQSQGEPLPFEKAASGWYRTIYLPLVAIIKRGHLLESFPNRTIDDLYAYISFHQWEKGMTRKYGIGIDQLIPKDMEAFRKNMADKKEFEYPEMQRMITAFVLINVSAKRGDRILNKLFDLEEVREVHSVHGDVDILAKVVLKRDLLSSDAEIIGQFVQNHVRQIPGIHSTQTLIPGLSKTKETAST